MKKRYRDCRYNICTEVNYKIWSGGKRNVLSWLPLRICCKKLKLRVFFFIICFYRETSGRVNVYNLDSAPSLGLLSFEQQRSPITTSICPSLHPPPPRNKVGMCEISISTLNNEK